MSKKIVMLFPPKPPTCPDGKRELPSGSDDYQRGWRDAIEYMISAASGAMKVEREPKPRPKKARNAKLALVKTGEPEPAA
jgi:hypothetical protein